jgi:hypothetical protein
MWSRRTLLSSSVWALATPLSGCGRFAHPDPPLSANDPKISNPNSPLTIDVHAHVFNGTDIPVERYITLVRARTDSRLDGLGEILDYAVNAIAPDGELEFTYLRELNNRGGKRDAKGEASAALQRERHRAEQYERGIRALKEGLANRQRALRSLDARADDRELIDAINNMPDRYDKNRKVPRQLRAGNDTIGAALRFATQQFNYRYVNAFDYLEEYGANTARKADLALCHMLDFDWALSRGQPSRTTVRQQIDLMEQLSILSGGRIHGYAPFDPYKQVAFGLGLTGEDPLSLVQTAVLRKGHIGVKMYPPMGFAPYGNKAKATSFWDKRWIADGLKRPDLGERLDRALEQLYAWCIEYKVPIMAHTAPSNMPDATFSWATDPARWPDLPVRGLQVNFGHFGDTELGLRKEPKLTRAYAGLMSAEGALGANFYADSAYFTDAVRGSGTLAAQLTALFRDTQPKRPANLANRLMYGSDWEMLLIESGETSAYLRNFEKLFARFDKEGSFGAAGKISDAFFGVNAARYLGLLDAESQCRKRLDEFYNWHGIKRPLWTIKVDCLRGACRADDRLVLNQP